MRFGPVPRLDAAGAILAHTHRVGGHHIPKGTVLTEAHLEALQQAGIEEVVVARLDPDDLHEDAAATEVASALEEDTVVAREARTGRVNLHARVPGVFRVDRMGVDDVNLVHESVTLATIAPWSVVEAGALVATVKVIPFASPRHVVRACASRAKGLLSVRPLPRQTAGMIVTELPGTQESVIAKAIAAQRARLEQHGSRLGRVEQVPHRVEELTAALQDLLDSGCKPVLLMGASATVDRHDVMPSALQAVGGVVDHLGMPMDPGNQMFLGHYNDTAVIGVPGCARTTRPGGFDVVLRRVLAGDAPDRHAIMRLGVGGLQKEGKVGKSPLRIGAAVLAAGQSRRMGNENKLLVEIDGSPMVTRVVDALLDSSVVEIVVVTGHESDLVRQALAGRPVRFVHNPAYTDGMSTSLRSGIEALAADARVDGALIALGDMPFIQTSHVEALVQRLAPEAGASIVVPVRAGRRGNPVVWARQHFEALQKIEGDKGARDIIGAHADDVIEVAAEDDAILVDLDTPEAVAMARRKR
ncbi:MAG: molybdopterin-binding/glycosyltransferase family 2 protein [Myxococcota bacterium]